MYNSATPLPLLRVPLHTGPDANALVLRPPAPLLKVLMHCDATLAGFVPTPREIPRTSHRTQLEMRMTTNKSLEPFHEKHDERDVSKNLCAESVRTGDTPTSPHLRTDPRRTTALIHPHCYLIYYHFTESV